MLRVRALARSGERLPEARAEVSGPSAQLRGEEPEPEARVFDC